MLPDDATGMQTHRIADCQECFGVTTFSKLDSSLHRLRITY